MYPKLRRLVFGTVFSVALLAAAVGGGVIAEYKLGWLQAFQEYRNQPDALPLLATELNSRSGLHQAAVAPLPGNELSRAQWRDQLRRRIINQISGSLFPQNPIQYQLVSKVVQSGLIEQDLIFTGFDGQLIPARLFTPSAAKSSPAVLLVPGHVKSGESGLLQLTEDERSYQHAAARKLAEAGFVTLAFELRGFGYLGEPEFPEHRAVAYNALQRGESYKSLILKDTASAMQLLRQMPEVDAARIAVAGASYGGEIAVQYAALDEQVAAVSFHSFGGWRGKLPALGVGEELPHFCHLFPVVDDWMFQEYWLWLLAPRPVQGVRGKFDQRRFTAQHDLYAKGWLNAEGLSLEVESGRHEFFVGTTVAFLKSRL